VDFFFWVRKGLVGVLGGGAISTNQRFRGDNIYC
jgi:hypothetical protein